MNENTLTLGSCRFELLEAEGYFLGLGRIWIGQRLVRSGRLPMNVKTQTFTGLKLKHLQLLDRQVSPEEIRIVTRAEFQPLDVKLMKDHSADPIHELGDWDRPAVPEKGKLTLVLRLASDAIFKHSFRGFSYHYEYESKTVPLFYLLDRGSWDLDGDILGATVISQSFCSAPVAKFDAETSWTTEGIVLFGEEAVRENPVMTHDFPRWTTHQAFDYQYKNDATLLGVFERVGLVRSVLLREAGKAELKTFDKHLFDQALRVTTVPKKILLNEEKRTEIDQQNLWTWTLQEMHDRARGEFGLKEEDFLPRLGHNYWQDFTVETYRKDLLPAAQAMGVKALFVDNLNKSDMTEKFPGNMCGSHAYEIAPALGGEEGVRKFVDDCREAGIEIFSWTKNSQSVFSPFSSAHDKQDWYLRMEDTRVKYGGAYTGAFSVWDFKNPEARNYWVKSLKKTQQATGLGGWFYDSFFNLAFMPVNYAKKNPTVMWKELLQALKELQDANVHFLIDSWGPFGVASPGGPASYNLKDTAFACYKVALGLASETTPDGKTVGVLQSKDAVSLYRAYAYMTHPWLPLSWEGKRLDEIWGPAHRRALADYYACYDQMGRRFLQEDDQGVIYHNREGTKATLWNFVARKVSLSGQIHDISTGQSLPTAESYSLEPHHTYSIESSNLPVTL